MAARAAAVWSTRTALLLLVAVLPAAQTTSQTPIGPTVRLLGAEVTVFLAGECGLEDVSDSPAHAFTDKSGEVHVLATDSTWRQGLGPSLTQVTKNCAVIHNSSSSCDPSLYTGWEWPYGGPTRLEDGTLMVLTHNEHHGWNCSANPSSPSCPHPTARQRCCNACNVPTFYRNVLHCQVTTITCMKSVDDGRSWQYCVQPPQHLIAAQPYKYKPDLPRFGYFRPTNLVHGCLYSGILLPSTDAACRQADRMYYALIHADNGSDEDHPAQATGQCLIRAATPTVPSSWRAWGGADFNISFVDPERAPADMVPEQHVCTPVSHQPHCTT